MTRIIVKKDKCADVPEEQLDDEDILIDGFFGLSLPGTHASSVDALSLFEQLRLEDFFDEEGADYDR